MNFSIGSSLKTQPENTTWFRATQTHHLPTALATAHTISVPSRYSEGNKTFEILYLAEDSLVALYEVQAMLGSPLHGVSLANPYQTWTILNVKVVLHRVAQITDVASQTLLDTSAQELTGDWRAYGQRSPLTSVSEPTGPAPTQELGAALFAVSGLEGFRTISARDPTKMILAVFPGKLGTGSSIEFKDEKGKVVASIPPAP